MKYAEVIIPQKVNGDKSTLTYLIPEFNSEIYTPGKMVEIPLRNKTIRGVIIEIHNQIPSFKTKPIIGIVENAPHLTKTQLHLLHFISDYYFTPLFKTLKIFLPVTFFKKKKLKMPPENPKLSESLIKLYPLTPEQKTAFKKINETQKNGILLHGITGSGKTEIYKHLAEQILKKNQQILILVPEISLTPQTFQHFKKHFGSNIAILHSELTPKQKETYWQQISQGDVKIIIGSRSAIFAPYQNLGMVVIDEEHETSFKQDNMPCYQTQTIAFEIAKLNNLKVILGSATPSLEAYTQALNGEFELVELNNRYQGGEKVSLPEVTIIDLREELKAKNFGIFSNELRKKMDEKLAAKEQIILFLNKRGAASAVICRDCGFVVKCNKCDIALTYHRRITVENTMMDAERLICHHCSKMEKPPSICPKCQSEHIRFIGLGTQKIEEEVKRVFPRISDRVLRADRDTIKKRGSFEEIYNSFKNHEADVLIGTQIIGKGLHLPKVNLVGVVLADFSLTIPDFRSSERTFQLLTQVAGRAGRTKGKGEVIIQTYMPEHFAVQAAKNHDFKDFYRQEIANRNELELPPYSKLLKITIGGFNHKKVFDLAKILFQELEKYHAKVPQENISSMNLYPALIPKLKNKFRWHILLSGKNPGLFLKNFPLLQQVKDDIKIDVDPLNTV